MKFLKSRMVQGIASITAASAIIIGGLTWNGQINLDNVKNTVEDLVGIIYGLNNDRNELIGIVHELNDRNSKLTTHQNRLEEIIVELESSNNDQAIEISDLRLLLGELDNELNYIQSLLSYNEEQLYFANRAIEKGLNEIVRLEDELTASNRSVKQLENDIDTLISKIDGVNPGIDNLEFEDNVYPSTDEMTTYQIAKDALINAQITGITENVQVYISSETDYNVKFKVIDTSNSILWTDDWATIQEVIDTIRISYGANHAWAQNVDEGEAYIFVQK